MDFSTVIIEDNPEMADYLQTILNDHNIIAFKALNGTKGLKLVKKVHPELVLLDLNLPDIEGKSICQQIKNEFPHIRVIMVTGQNTALDIASGLDLGADDYLTKPINETELMARIRARLRSSKYKKKRLTCDDLELNQETHQVTRDGKDIKLSPQEYRLLEYLMINQGKVLSRQMILSRIWGGNPDLETRVVDIYVSYLRNKIDFKEPKLIETIRGFGYSLRPHA